MECGHPLVLSGLYSDTIHFVIVTLSHRFIEQANFSIYLLMEEMELTWL